jgi:hypothetical protein
MAWLDGYYVWFWVETEIILRQSVVILCAKTLKQINHGLIFWKPYSLYLLEVNFINITRGRVCLLKPQICYINTTYVERSHLIRCIFWTHEISCTWINILVETQPGIGWNRGRQACKREIKLQIITFLLILQYVMITQRCVSATLKKTQAELNYLRIITYFHYNLAFLHIFITVTSPNHFISYYILRHIYLSVFHQQTFYYVKSIIFSQLF